MIVLGLTGGMGMGKSTAAERLRRAGIPLVDTDQLAREVVVPGAPAWEEIRAAFGAAFIQADGTLDRSALAERVFSDPAARRTLEAITHPRIRRLWQDWIEGLRPRGTPLATVIIPLLFETETPAAQALDVTVCVACSADTQRERLRQRGWTRAQMEQRMAAQLPIREKMRRSDYVVWNEGPLDCLQAQLNRILQSIAIHTNPSVNA